MRHFRSRLPLLVMLGVWLWSELPAAAAPREELLQLVPEDVSLCLVVNNLRAHSDKLRTVPWLTGLRQTSLGKALLQAPELQQLVKLDQDLRQFAEIGWSELRDEIFGDCVVLAFHHAEKKENERGVLMLWAKNPALLDKLIQRVNQEQKKNGEIKALEEKDYRGVKYTLRRETKQNQYYLRQGPLFLFTTDEPMLRQVIDRKVGVAKTSTMVQSFERLGAEQALVTLWVNPRPFDAQWKPTAQDSSEGAVAKQAFAQYWQALDAVAVSLTAGPDLELSVALQGRPDKLPSAARKFLQTAAMPSDLWQQFPTKSILTTAARVDFGALAQMLEEFTPETARPKIREHLQMKFGPLLGMDFATDVLPRLGPDVGFCLAANPGGNPIPDMLFALRLQPGPKDTPLDQALFKILQLAPVGFNSFQKDPKDYMKLLGEQQGSIEVKYLSQPHFPPGFQPAFALKNGFLVMASSPQVIQRFGPNAAKPKDTPLLHLSFPELTHLLKTQRQWFLNKVADKNHLPEQAAGKWLDNMLEVFNLLDHLHVRQELTQGQATWTIRLQTNAAQK